MKAVKHAIPEVTGQAPHAGIGECLRQRLRMTLVATASLSALALSGYTHAAGRVFYDGFESGNTNLWQQDGSRNKCNVVANAADGGGPRSGTQMVRCNWNGTLDWDAAAVYETLMLSNYSYGSELLIRFWIRPDSNAKDHPGNGPKILRLGSESFWALNFRTGSANGSFYNSNNDQIGSTFWGGANLSDGKWHKLEFYIKQGTSNGVFKYWEDGALRHSATNVNTTPANGKWSPFYISSNWSGAAGCCDHNSTNYLYWDDVEIFADTGTGASGSLADASVSSSSTSAATTPPAPSAPSGLGVTTTGAQ